MGMSVGENKGGALAEMNVVPLIIQVLTWNGFSSIAQRKLLSWKAITM
jgi:hypothetical protein